MNGYILLGLAIVLELVSTSMLKASEGFTRIIPGAAFLVGMGASFYMLSQALTSIPLSIAYAIWSGVGTALTALIGILVWKEQLTGYSALGILLIVAGVVLLNFKGTGHSAP